MQKSYRWLVFTTIRLVFDVAFHAESKQRQCNFQLEILAFAVAGTL